jgi:Secretion system C-terminal sorting domain
MKKFFLLLIHFINYFDVNAQAPYIGDGGGEGLGQYGYIEKDAASFLRLYRNSHTNVEYLGARFWVDAGSGVEWIYYTNYAGDSWQCSGNNDASKTTQNFNSSNFGSQWVAGANVYVSVRSGYCGGATGGPFNERQFQIFDFQVKNDIPSGSIFDADGNCGQTATKGNNVVATFTVNVGSLAGKTLDRFFFENTGSFVEGTHIPNAGFKLFYENSTGSESFNGSESSVQLYGDWGGNSTTNNIFGADGMGIPISGTTRFYLVVCDLINGSFNPTAVGTYTNAISVNVLNDGLSLGPSLNGKNLARMDQTSMSFTAPLPVSIERFSAKNDDNRISLEWLTAEEANNDYFEVQRSIDGKSFVKIGEVKGAGNSKEKNLYTFEDNQPESQMNYYRLKQVDFSGKFTFSKIIAAQLENTDVSVSVFPNPSSEVLKLKNFENVRKVEIYNTKGNLVKSELGGKAEMSLKGLQNGLYFIKLFDRANKITVEKILVSE